MQDLIFAQPLWLYSGIVLALGVLLAFAYLDRKNRRDLGKFASGQFLAGIRTGISKPRRIFKRTCYILGVLFLFAAIARPQSGFEWREVKRKGIDILFAIDSSRSMLAEDMSPNRLERVKLGMIDFVEKLDGDRIGLLPFAGSSFLLCPLTLDYNTFKDSLDAVDTGIIPHKGTDIASAIREADAIFEEAGNNHRILVVLTDGEDLQGEALTAAKEAGEKGMIIHTVGIGSADGELIPIGGSYLRDSSGNPVKTRLDEAGLKAISEATEGTYANFGQLGEGLQTIYQEKLALVPKEELKQRMQKVPIEQYQWPLGAAILLFLLDFIISDRRRPAKPAANSSGSPLAKAALILTAGVLALSPSVRAESAPETYNSGITAFSDGDFEKAQKAFHDTLTNTTDLSLQARSYYNLGNTLFNIGAGKLEESPKDTIADWEKSLSSYESSLKLNPKDPDAEYNRDYVKKLLEELKKQEDQQQDQQENKDENQEDSEEQESKDDSEKQDQENSESGEQDQEQQDQSDEEKEGDSGEEDQDEESEEEKQGQSGEDSEEEQEGEESQQSKEGEEGEESEEQKGKPGEEGQEGDEKNADQAAGEQARKAPGEMSPEEARELLKALEKDEKRVILIPQKVTERNPKKNNTKGKDW